MYIALAVLICDLPATRCCYYYYLPAQNNLFIFFFSFVRIRSYTFYFSYFLAEHFSHFVFNVNLWSWCCIEIGVFNRIFYASVLQQSYILCINWQSDGVGSAACKYIATEIWRSALVTVFRKSRSVALMREW